MGGFGFDLSEKPLKNLVKASDFQAEYEGSIPFTRSRSFPVNLNLGGWPRSAAGKTSIR